MKTYILLLRGVNVGGNNTLSMKDLVSLLEKLGFQDVGTYIQSGNAVFRHEAGSTSALANSICSEINQEFGLTPFVLVLEASEMERALKSNPFPEAESEPKTLHLYFLSKAPANPDIDRLEKARLGEERFALKGKVFYLHAPDGVRKSKLAAQAERALGVSATARNWRTVSKLMELAKERGR